MKNKIIITILVSLFVFSFATKLSFTQLVIKPKPEQKPIPISQQQIIPDYVKVSEITGWDLDTSKYFISEANVRGVSVFGEALPLVYVETGGIYDFKLIHHNTNGTSDVGIFQINDVTYKDVVKLLKAEGKEFDSWNRLNPQFNIAAGMAWISYLKGKGLGDHTLFTSFNRGVVGARNYANRSGTYITRYSKEVHKAKENILNY